MRFNAKWKKRLSLPPLCHDLFSTSLTAERLPNLRAIQQCLVTVLMCSDCSPSEVTANYRDEVNWWSDFFLTRHFRGLRPHMCFTSHAVWLSGKIYHSPKAFSGVKKSYCANPTQRMAKGGNQSFFAFNRYWGRRWRNAREKLKGSFMKSREISTQ